MYRAKALIGWYLQGEEGQSYEFAPNKVVCLPAGQLSIMTLPRFFAVPKHWTDPPTTNEVSSNPSVASGASHWQMLQLSDDSEAGNHASQTKAAKMLSGTALAPH